MDRDNESDMEDSDYRQYFNNALKEFYNRTGGGGDEEELNKDGNDEEELNGDPEYDCFLENIKQDENEQSFTVQIPIGSGMSLLLRYDGEDEKSFEDVDRRRNFLSNLTSKKATVSENLGGFSGKVRVDTPKAVKKSLEIGDQVIKKKTRDVPDLERKSGDNKNVQQEGPEVDPDSCKSSGECSKKKNCVVKDVGQVPIPVSLDKSGTNSEPSYEEGQTSTHHKDDGNSSDVEVFTLDNLPLQGDYTPFVSSKSLVIEEIGDGIRSSSRSQFREELMDLLKMPYNKVELDKLWRDVTIRTPVEGVKDLRHGRMKSYSTKTNGKSYLDGQKELRAKVDEFKHDKRKVLHLLRGFFFWLKNIVHEGAFKPWLDLAFLKALNDQKLHPN